MDDYDLGFSIGFLQDDYYWDGFDDSYDTEDIVYYAGSEIPYVASPPYDAGYWDGVWQAYNDGYFVCYDYAFTIGFSEGYDAAFQEDYLDFLDDDVHIEYDNGGWADGYNDGFSEGRVFGAYDYEAYWEFDWLDAMLDYRSGTDLYFEEVDVGTGVYGPVYLYEYGTDPNDLKSNAVPRGQHTLRIRQDSSDGQKASTEKVSYRALTSEVQTLLDTQPTTTPRNPNPIAVDGSWLDRIEAYLESL